MIPSEILKKIRQSELRTNRLVTKFAVGARASARFTARAPARQNSKPLEFETFRNYGEFAIIRNLAGRARLVLIPSNSTGLKTWAAAG